MVQRGDSIRNTGDSDHLLGLLLGRAFLAKSNYMFPELGHNESGGHTLEKELAHAIFPISGHDHAEKHKSGRVAGSHGEEPYLERPFQALFIVIIGFRNLGAQSYERFCSLAVSLSGNPTHTPSLLQHAADNRASNIAGRA